MNKTTQYLTKGYNNPMSKMIAKVLPSDIVLSFVEIEKSKSAATINTPNLIQFTFPKIEKTNECIEEIKKCCEEFNFRNKISLCVFGSISSDEVIEYSDFDACLIYDEKSFESKQELFKLREMIERVNLLAHLQDSLQHHGLIITGRSEIKKGPFITQCLIKESKLIYGTAQIELSESVNTNFDSALTNLSNSILNKLENESKWSNQYFFKNLISELLLFPCSYLQKYHRKYISKKDSFEIIKTEFTIDEIQLITTIENIRKAWQQRKMKLSELNESHIKNLKNNEKTNETFINELLAIKTPLIQFIKSRTFQ